MTEAGLLMAFLGGLLALLSPCGALLLPAFFAYSFAGPTRLLLRTLFFYAGLCATLVPLGAAGALAGRLLTGHREVLVAVGGWTLVALGLAQILGLGFGSRRMQRAAGARRDGSALSVAALGAVYGLAGFCAGPILGSVLTVSAVGGDPVRGALLLAVYALGMAVPLFVLALAWDRFELGRRRWLRGRAVRLGPLTMHSTSAAGGLLFVLTGVAFLVFDGMASLGSVVDLETEYAWEERLAEVGALVSDRTVLLALCAVAAAGALAVLLRPGRRTAEPAAEEPERAPEPARSGGGG
ncbi:cytochrome c biogenesis CcdA family protein [Streptomyces albidoflavus]|uniref:cytochrome c biogenesis CcdA family protein n=1 Tax=Streptomyces albidoflavus TaxID=1886 RepID=UPI0033DF5AEF